MKRKSLLAVCAYLLCAKSLFAQDVPRRAFPIAEGYVLVEVWGNDKIHFQSGPGDAPDTTMGIWRSPQIADSAHPQPTDVTFSDNGLDTESLEVRIDFSSSCVVIRDKQRGYYHPTICLEQLNKGSKGFRIDAAEYSHAYGLGQNFLNESVRDPNLVGQRHQPGRYGNELRGFSGGATGFTTIPVAYFLGVGQTNSTLFMNHPYKLDWDLRSRPWRMRTWGDALRWFVIAGDDLGKLRQSYMNLTGHPALLGLNKFGYWMSEFGFDNWDEVDRHLGRMRSFQLPIDGFSMDLQWYGGRFNEPDTSRMGSLTWDEEAFPSPGSKIAEYRSKGIELMLIEQPYVAINLPAHGVMEERGLLARDCEDCAATYIDYNPWWGRGGMVDYSNPAANQYWHEYKRQPLIDDFGITNHWCDLGEPEMYNAWAWYHGFSELGLHQQGDVHNLYALMWARGIVNGYQATNPELRPFILTRSGNAGSQRYYTALWSGDIGANLTSMRAHYRNQMHLSLAGIDYYGADIGGFYRPALDGDEDDFFTRWFANGLLTDVPARSHVWNIPGVYTSDPTEVGDLRSHAYHINLRYELIPYLYSAARIASEHAVPLVAPLVYHHQDDATARSITEQKYLGESLLLNLITDYNNPTKQIYLPAGRWTWRDNNIVMTQESAGWTTLPVFKQGFVNLPLLAKEGAVIPVSKVANPRNADAAMGEVGVDIYPSREATEFELYSDDGRTTAHLRGEYRLEVWQQQWRSDAEVAVTGNLQHESSSEAVYGFERSVRLIMPDYEVEYATLNGRRLRGCGKNSKIDCLGRENGYAVVVAPALKSKSPVEIVFHIAARSDMTVAAYFACAHESNRAFYAVGSDATLGAWNPDRGVALDRQEGHSSGAWITDLPADTTLEWKCVAREGDRVVWQDGDNNVAVTGSAMWAGAHVSRAAMRQQTGRQNTE